MTLKKKFSIIIFIIFSTLLLFFLIYKNHLWVIGHYLSLFIVFIEDVFFYLISYPYIYPILYWITYISAIIGFLAIFIIVFWYGKVRKRFSSPVKDGSISAFKFILIVIIILGFSQFLLSIFFREIFFQLSNILFIISAIFLGIRVIVNIPFSILFRPTNKTLEDLPLVSIIIPAYNEGKVIEKTINSLFRLNYNQKEIIVVDDGSRDETLKIARNMKKNDAFKVISKKKNGGKWSALNKGIEKAKGNILVCIDADTILNKNAILPLIKHFSDSKVGAVAGNVKVGNRDKFLTKLQALEYISDLNIQRRTEAYFNKVSVVPGPLGAFRKSIIKQVGFYSGDTFAEDADLTLKILKAGYKIKYEPKAIGYTEAPAFLIDLAKQRYRWYRGLLQVIIKHKDMLFNSNYGITGVFMIPWIFLNGLIFSWLNFITVLWLFLFVLNPISGFLMYIEIYIFWFFFIWILDTLINAYAICVDEEEKIKLIFYIIAYKLFYGYIINTIRILSQLEQYLNYPMRWETTKRINSL